MTDVTTDLSPDNAEQNFLYWSKFLCCQPDQSNPSDPPLIVPLAHTFPARKVWHSGEKDLCYEILESGTGLVSDHHRDINGHYLPDEPRPKMARARTLQLNKFVFAYLGVHDPVYARNYSDGLFTQSFGLFLKRSIESFPYCNATRRDLASVESSFLVNPNADFLFAEHGRRLCRCEIVKTAKHKGDFWQYWGAGEFWKPAYISDHWKWKYEFHFLDRVPVDDFEAILWPEVSAGMKSGGTGFSALHDRAKAFQQHYPQCKIVFYEWNDRAPIMSFVNASTAVTKFRLARGDYPQFAGEALAHFGYSA